MSDFIESMSDGRAGELSVDWLTDNKLPVGKAARVFVDWLTDHGAWFFDGLAAGLEFMIDGILWVLQGRLWLLEILRYRAATIKREENI